MTLTPQAGVVHLLDSCLLVDGKRQGMVWLYFPPLPGTQGSPQYLPWMSRGPPSPLRSVRKRGDSISHDSLPASLSAVCSDASHTPHRHSTRRPRHRPRCPGPRRCSAAFEAKHRPPPAVSPMAACWPLGPRAAIIQPLRGLRPLEASSPVLETSQTHGQSILNVSFFMWGTRFLGLL